MVKTIKNLLLWNPKADDLKVCMHHRVLEYYQVCSSNGPILRQGQIWSLMLLYEKKVKQWIFQKIFKSMMSELVDAVN